MYTQCPHCSMVYPVEPAQLAEARGRLCCGSCGQEFDALQRLAATPQQIGDPPSPVTPPRVDPPIDPSQADLFAAPVEASRAATAAEAAIAAADRATRIGDEPTSAPAGARDHCDASAVIAPPVIAPPPSFARRGAGLVRRPRRGRWAVVAMLLAVTLGLQIALAQRVELAADPRWRPALEWLCSQLRCELPAWRDPERLLLLEREVGPHPSVPDALLVTATVRNEAPWPQAWPLLELTMADLEGRPVARRRFRPDEYLGEAPDRATLAPGQTVAARLELADPGKQAVAFDFEFR